MFLAKSVIEESVPERVEFLGWADLPSVVILEITKNLHSRKDRLNTSSVCKSWRSSGFQVPLSDSLHLNMTKGEKDVPSVTFLSQLFICKVSHVTFTFDVSSEACINVVEQVLEDLLENSKLKSLKLVCSDLCLDHLQRFGTIVEGAAFIQKVLYPLKKVLKGKAALETFSFPLIQDLSAYTGRNLISTLLHSRSRFTLSKMFLPSLKFVGEGSMDEEDNDMDGDVPAIPELNLIQGFVKLQMLSLGHDCLSDEVLQTLGQNSTVGGLKRMSLVAVQQNPNITNKGWAGFVRNNPTCRVRLTVYGGTGLVAHASNLIFPSTPLSHFRSYYSKDMRINFLNSMIGWNLESLEHLELVGDNYCNWMDVLMQLDPDENQFLDPIIYAAWRCKTLHTIKLGLRYCGDSLVGIARLKGATLLNLEIPKSRIINDCLNTRKLIKEVSSALGRPWKPLNSNRQRRFPKRCPSFESGSCMILNATAEDEL